jgi:hypothetical protein
MSDDEAEDNPLRPCACGSCDRLVSRGGNGRQQYAPGHRQRGHRKRVKAAMEAAGLPANPSLKAARAKGRTNQRHGDAQKPARARSNRKGNGVRLYISTAEAEALLRGEISPGVVAKVRAKLKPADPLPGQLDIVTELEEQHATRDA